MIALCLGGARTVWRDLAAAEALLGNRPRLIIACNFAGITYPGRLDAWVSLHPEYFDPWRAERAERGLNTDYGAFVHAAEVQTTAGVVACDRRGSSGLYMTQIALGAMGAHGAILCGVPMDDTGQHIHWPGAWEACERYRPAFEAAKNDGEPIRSMSGWSARLFGKPDNDWIGSLET